MVNKSAIQRTSEIIKAANGSEIPILGEITLPIQIGQFKSIIRGLVSDHVAEIIIGINWLSANDIGWDFGGNRVHIRGKKYDLQRMSQNAQWCRRVTLQEDVVVPARSEIDLPTKVVSRDLRGIIEDEAQWGTGPSVLQRGIYVSGTLVPQDRFRDVPIRILNTTHDPVCLYADRNVIQLHAVTVVCSLELREEATLQCRSTKETTQQERVPEFIHKLLDDVHPSVPESIVLKLEELLTSYQDVISTSALDLGRTDIVKHHIDTGGAPPFRQPLRRFPPAHVKAISEHVENMLQQKVIEPACSPYASNLVLVKKKDQTYR